MAGLFFSLARLVCRNSEAWRPKRARRAENPPQFQQLEIRILLTYGPWMGTTFNQTGGIPGSNYAYNQYVPVDPANGQRSLTGCIATAETQLLHYWRFPATIALTNGDKYISQSGTTGIDIDDDAATYFFPTFDTINAALATIDYNDPSDLAMMMFATGILGKARYTAGSTAAFITAGTLDRLGFQSADQSSSWAAVKSTVISNIALGLPVLLGINSTINVGHEVILDGYNPDTQKFHVKFGWGGLADGWYDPTSMNVPNYSFNRVESIIYNIKPTLDIPGGLTASAGAAGQVEVKWSPVAGVKGYQLYRSTTNDIDTATRIGPATILGTIYEDNSASGAPYTTYYYWVRAITNIGSSPFSVVASSKVNSATTFTNLGTAPTIDYGTSSVTFTGKLTAGVTPLPNGKTVKITIDGVSKTTTTFDGDGSFTLNFNTGSMAAGSYTITYEFAGDSVFSEATNSLRKLTIKKLTLTVSGITALDKIYDATTNATLNTAGKTLLGVLPGDVVTLSTASAIGNFANKNVGTDKTVSISGMTLGGGDSGNYTLAAHSTLADITPRPITVAADDLSKAYGKADPKFTYEITVGDLAGSDLLTGNLSREKGTHVGSYAINQGTLAAGGNYTLTFIGGTLEILPALLTVTALNKAMTFGGVMPKFNASYKGFMAGDSLASLTIKPVIDSLATNTSDVAAGPYDITPSGASDSDYDFAYVAGLLTIRAANSTTQLLSTPTSPVFSQQLTLTAIVKSGASAIQRIGTITFYEDNVQIGAPIALDANSSASITLTPSTVGVHRYRAVYASNGNWKNSMSGLVARNILKNKTAIVLAPSDPGPIAVNQAIDLVATVSIVSPGAGTPTGIVTFRDGGVILGTAALDGSGVATLAGVTFAVARTHRITASYAGDLTDRGVNSLVLLLVVA